MAHVPSDVLDGHSDLRSFRVRPSGPAAYGRDQPPSSARPFRPDGIHGSRSSSAAEAFSSAITKDRLLTIAHYGLGQAYMNMEQYTAAVQAYKGCIDAARALHALRQTNQFESDRRRQDAIRALKETLGPHVKMDQLKRTQIEQQLRDLENQRISIDAPFQAPAEALLALGSAYFRNGDREEAEIEWKAAIAVNPKLGQAHNNLAVIYMQTGRLNEAEQEIKLAEQSGFRVNSQFREDLKKKKASR